MGCRVEPPLLLTPRLPWGAEAPHKHTHLTLMTVQCSPAASCPRRSTPPACRCACRCDSGGPGTLGVDAGRGAWKEMDVSGPLVTWRGRHVPRV